MCLTHRSLERADCLPLTWLELFNYFQLEARKNCKSLSFSWYFHLFSVFFFLFYLIQGWNIAPSKASWPNFQISEPFVFLYMCAIFTIFVQQWPLEFQNNFPSPSWCPHVTQEHKHLRDLWASSHLLVGKIRAIVWCIFNSRCWAWRRVCWVLRGWAESALNS